MPLLPLGRPLPADDGGDTPGVTVQAVGPTRNSGAPGQIAAVRRQCVLRHRNPAAAVGVAMVLQGRARAVPVCSSLGAVTRRDVTVAGSVPATAGEWRPTDVQWSTSPSRWWALPAGCRGWPVRFFAAQVRVQMRMLARWPARLVLLPLLECSGGVLVGPDDGGVDRDSPVDVVVGGRRGWDSSKDPLPGAVDGPSDQAPVGGLERAESVRQVAPGRAGAVLPSGGFLVGIRSSGRAQEEGCRLRS